MPPALIEAALALELEAGEVVADTVEDRGCIFLAGLHRAEQAIAERLQRACGGARRPGRRSTRQGDPLGGGERPGWRWPRARARRYGWRFAPRCW